MQESERILRKIECQVLDRHYLDFPLLQRNVNDAIPALLRCYSDVVRDLRNGSIPKDSHDAKHKTANEGSRGLAHCIRWVQSKCPRLIFVPSPSRKILSEDALSLLQWGVKYDPLYNQHVAYSRMINGQRCVEAEVDGENKSITFLPREDIDSRFFVSQIEAKKAGSNRQASSYPVQKLAECWQQWSQSAIWGQDGVQFDDKIIAASGALDAVIGWLQDSCLPELNDSDQMGDFSAGELRQVLAAFHISSFLRIKLEDDIHQVLTHVLSWRICRLIDWLHEITSVDRCKLKSMLPIFIFDGEPERVTIAHKPLILGADNRVFLSPRIFLMVPLSEMVVGALNLDSVRKKSYDCISNSIEKSVVIKLTDDIHRKFPQGSQTVSEETFMLPDKTQQITPDILLLSKDQSELLVIDVKNATPPFGVGDIANDLKTWSEKWVPQVQKYVDAFKGSPSILNKCFNFDKVKDNSLSVMGLILLRYPFPVPVMIPDNLGAIDWPTLSGHLSSDANHSNSILRLWKWIRERPDLVIVDSLEWIEQEIVVNKWTYKYSELSPRKTTD